MRSLVESYDPPSYLQNDNKNPFSHHEPLLPYDISLILDEIQIIAFHEALGFISNSK